MVYHESAKVDGKSITFTRYGEWTKVCCLFFHGFLASSDFLPPDADSEGMCVISFDRPGIGNSDSIGKYTMEGFCKIITDILKEHEVESVHVFGHSAGGYYAQVYAQEFPDMTRTLTLLSSLPPLNCEETEHLMTDDLRKRRLLVAKAKLLTRFYFVSATNVINKKCDNIVKDRIELMAPFEQEVYRKHTDVYKNGLIMSATKKGKGAFYDAIALFSPKPHPVIDPKIPVYVWNGEADTTTTVEFAEYMSKAYKAKELHVIPGGTHMMFFAVWHDAVKEVNCINNL